MASGPFQQSPKRYNVYEAYEGNNNNPPYHQWREQAHNTYYAASNYVPSSPRDTRDRVLHGRVDRHRRQPSSTPAPGRHHRGHTPSVERGRSDLGSHGERNRWHPATEVAFRQMRQEMNALRDSNADLRREVTWLRESQIASNKQLQLQSTWLYVSYCSLQVPPPPFFPVPPPPPVTPASPPPPAPVSTPAPPVTPNVLGAPGSLLLYPPPAPRK